MRAILFCTLVLVGWHAAAFGAESGLREKRIPATVKPGCETHLGPIYDAHQRPFDNGTETEMVGPFLFWAHTVRIAEGGLRPLFYRAEDRFIDHREWLFVYPLMTFTRYGEEGRWQFFQLLSWTTGRPASDIERHERKFTLFPIYWQKRSEVPNENYTALFPIRGTIKDRMGFREVDFTIFPLYGHTLNRKNVETIYVVWPFVHVPVGKGAHGFSFWPLFGHRRQEGLFRRDFALWPIVARADFDLDTDNPRHVSMVLPFYALQRSKTLDFTSAPWPFYTVIHDKKNDYRERGFPWPFVAFGHGPDRDTKRVWPFYGHAKTTEKSESSSLFSFMPGGEKKAETHETGHESRFVLWPLWSQRKQILASAERTRTRSMLIVFSDLQEKVEGAPAVGRRVDLWPLFTWARDTEGNVRFQTLSILAPVLPNNHGVAVNYEPLWGLVRWQRAKDGERAFSLLWNTARHESGPTRRNFSLLAGLFQYQRDENRKEMRLFYFLRFSKANVKKTTQPKSPEKNVDIQHNR